MNRRRREPEVSQNLVNIANQMSQNELEQYFAWLDEIKFNISWNSLTAFILGVRPEFISSAYNFDTPDFKKGFYVEFTKGKYDIRHLNHEIAMELLFDELYSSWRTYANLKKHSVAWEKLVKHYIYVKR